MVLGIVTKENVKLFVIIALGLVFLSLIFIPMEQWTFIIDWLIQTPIVIIIGQSIFFLISIVAIWSFVLILKELMK